MIKSKLRVRDFAVAQVQCNPTLKDGFRFAGYFKAECFDKDGNLKWVESGRNLVVNDGLDHALDVIFHGAAQIDPWYVGTKTASGGILATDSLSAHPGWTEFVGYTGNRKEYVEGAVSGQSISNSASPASFDINATGTVAGAFLCSVASSNVGLLFSVVDFATTRSVDSGDVVNVTYSLTTSDDGI